MSTCTHIQIPNIIVNEYNILFEDREQIIRVRYCDYDNEYRSSIIDPNWRYKLWKIITHPIWTRQLNIISTHYVTTCKKCTDINSLSNHTEPNIWYRITAPLYNVYIDINNLLLHEIIQHSLPIPIELMHAINKIPIDALDCTPYNIKTYRSTSAITSSITSSINYSEASHNNWPIIRIQPLYQKYGIHYLAPTLSDYCTQLANNENHIVGPGNNYYDTNITQFLKKINEFVDSAGTPDSICNFAIPDITHPTYNTCPVCAYNYEQSLLIFRDWQYKVCYQLDRHTSHIMRQHQLPIPIWFMQFILYEII